MAKRKGIIGVDKMEGEYCVFGFDEETNRDIISQECFRTKMQAVSAARAQKKKLSKRYKVEIYAGKKTRIRW